MSNEERIKALEARLAKLKHALSRPGARPGLERDVNPGKAARVATARVAPEADVSTAGWAGTEGTKSCEECGHHHSGVCQEVCLSGSRCLCEEGTEGAPYCWRGDGAHTQSVDQTAPAPGSHDHRACDSCKGKGVVCGQCGKPYPCDAHPTSGYPARCEVCRAADDVVTLPRAVADEVMAALRQGVVGCFSCGKLNASKDSINAALAKLEEAMR